MLWQMQSAHFSVRSFSLDVAGLSPCTVNVIGHQKKEWKDRIMQELIQLICSCQEVQRAAELHKRQRPE